MILRSILFTCAIGSYLTIAACSAIFPHRHSPQSSTTASLHATNQNDCDGEVVTMTLTSQNFSDSELTTIAGANAESQLFQAKLRTHVDVEICFNELSNSARLKRIILQDPFNVMQVTADKSNVLNSYELGKLNQVKEHFNVIDKETGLMSLLLPELGEALDIEQSVSGTMDADGQETSRQLLATVIIKNAVIAGKSTVMVALKNYKSANLIGKESQLAKIWAGTFEVGKSIEENNECIGNLESNKTFKIGYTTVYADLCNGQVTRLGITDLNPKLSSDEQKMVEISGKDELDDHQFQHLFGHHSVSSAWQVTIGDRTYFSPDCLKLFSLNIPQLGNNLYFPCGFYLAKGGEVIAASVPSSANFSHFFETADLVTFSAIDPQDIFNHCEGESRPNQRFVVGKITLDVDFCDEEITRLSVTDKSPDVPTERQHTATMRGFENLISDWHLQYSPGDFGDGWFTFTINKRNYFFPSCTTGLIYLEDSLGQIQLPCGFYVSEGGRLTAAYVTDKHVQNFFDETDTRHFQERDPESLFRLDDEKSMTIGDVKIAWNTHEKEILRIAVTDRDPQLPSERQKTMTLGGLAELRRKFGNQAGRQWYAVVGSRAYVATSCQGHDASLYVPKLGFLELPCGFYVFNLINGASLVSAYQANASIADYFALSGDVSTLFKKVDPALFDIPFEELEP